MVSTCVQRILVACQGLRWPCKKPETLVNGNTYKTDEVWNMDHVFVDAPSAVPASQPVALYC